MIKRDSELLTSANQIKNEAAAGANTAARVGGHLADMVRRLGSADIKVPDSTAPYKPTRPCVTFKFDDCKKDHSQWPEHFNAYYAARVAAGKHTYLNLPTDSEDDPYIPGTLAFPFEWPKTDTPLYTGSSFTIDANALTITNTDAGAHDPFTDTIEPEMVISIVSVGLDNHENFFVVQTVTADVITVYPAYGVSGYSSDSEEWSSLLLSESVSQSMSIYRGRRYTSTWAQIKEAIDLGWTIAGHGRTHRPIGGRSYWPTQSAEAVWGEIYNSRILLNAKLTELMGETYEVEHFVVPFGRMFDYTPYFIRQAGWKSSNSYSWDGIDYEFVRNSIDPWHIDEENSHALIDAGNALTGTGAITAGETTLTGDGTNFDGEGAELAVGDIIAVWNNNTAMHTGGVYQVRRVTEIASDTSLTVDSAWGANCTIASGATIYKCSAETAGDGFDIGILNYIAANGGWLQVAQHAPYDGVNGQDQFNRSPYAAILDYIDYLNEDGADILIRDRDAAYEIHRPLLEAGTAFAVNHNCVMIRRAWSPNLIISEQGNVVLGATISTYKIPDEDIATNRFTIYHNESTNKLIIRFRNRLGAMQVGEIALTEE